MFRRVGLGEFVRDDLNGNALQKARGPGVDGMNVNLLGAGLEGTFGTLDDVTGTTATAGGGLYSFTGLRPDNDQLTFVAPAGRLFSPQDQGVDDTVDSDANTATGVTGNFSVTSGTIDNTHDAGMFLPAVLGDFVWNDTDADGVQDAGELGVDGVTVNLRGAGVDGLFNTADDMTATTTTAGGGLYHFNGLVAGLYQVTFVAPAGSVFTAQNAGVDDAVDSDATPVTGQTATITLTAGQTDSSTDAGLIQSVGLGDFVWEDFDGNGHQDVGEPGSMASACNSLALA